LSRPRTARAPSSPARSAGSRLVVAVAAMLAVGLVASSCAGDGEPAAGSDPAGAPAAAGEAVQAAPVPDAEAPPVTLAFGGDVHFEGVVRQRLSRDPDSTFDPVSEVLSAADLAMVNLETAVTERGTPDPKQYTFRSPPTAFSAMSAAGIDVATLANNHGMDYGEVGLRDTLESAEEAGFPLVGAGLDDDEAFAPHVAEISGQRIALLGTTQVLDDYATTLWRAEPGKPGLASARDEDRLLRAVREAREEADTVVVYAHYGQERNPCPIERQVTLTERLVEAGADVVVGAHAHVLLGGGWMGDAYVHYGLGNFLWYDSRGGDGSRSGVLTLTVQGRSVTEAQWTPAKIANGQTTPLTGAAAQLELAAAETARDCTGLSAEPPTD
jgi:poly-gamma-glutamate capsule biosynthesis protein CapA/YwtB (metallophosphatase superfamily)